MPDLINKLKKEVQLQHMKKLFHYGLFLVFVVLTLNDRSQQALDYSRGDLEPASFSFSYSDMCII